MSLRHRPSHITRGRGTQGRRFPAIIHITTQKTTLGLQAPHPHQRVFIIPHDTRIDDKGNVYCRRCNGKEHAPVKLYVPNCEVSITAKALRVTKMREHELNCKGNVNVELGGGSKLLFQKSNRLLGESCYSFNFKGPKVKKSKRNTLPKC